jgi:4-carboxymuconolactone decarboxylase
MTSSGNPFDDLMKMGQDWAKTIGVDSDAFSMESLEKLWPTMSKEAMEAFMGKGASPEGLDAKTKLLLTLQGLTTMGAEAETQIRTTVRHALAAGASTQEVTETIALAGLFGGAPAMTKAMVLAKEVFDGQEGKA